MELNKIALSWIQLDNNFFIVWKFSRKKLRHKHKHCGMEQNTEKMAHVILANQKRVFKEEGRKWGRKEVSNYVTKFTSV